VDYDGTEMGRKIGFMADILSTDRKQGAERNSVDISEATGWITGGIAEDQR
jgi:hypothetical protein